MIDVRPMAGLIGAEIFGVDLTQPLSPEDLKAVRAAWLKWKVVFFRDQDITQAQHRQFALQFGEPVPGHPTLPAQFPDFPEILLLDSKQMGGDGMGGLGGGAQVESRWHTDVTFVPEPPAGSILRGVVVPEYGGDTQWLNLAAAYAELSEPLKTLIDGLTAVHHNILPMKRGEMPGGLAKIFLGDGLRAVHPVVRVHPETGEQAIFVNPLFTSHILELTRNEGRRILEMLYEHMTDEKFTVRLRWQPGTIAFWDNRATCHIVPTDVPAGMHRSMQRITITGDTPTGPSGFKSHALKN